MSADLKETKEFISAINGCCQNLLQKASVEDCSRLIRLSWTYLKLMVKCGRLGEMDKQLNSIITCCKLQKPAAPFLKSILLTFTADVQFIKQSFGQRIVELEKKIVSLWVHFLLKRDDNEDDNEIMPITAFVCRLPTFEAIAQPFPSCNDPYESCARFFEVRRLYSRQRKQF